jgi:hypothetical protein
MTSPPLILYPTSRYILLGKVEYQTYQFGLKVPSADYVMKRGVLQTYQIRATGLTVAVGMN